MEKECSPIADSVGKDFIFKSPERKEKTNVSGLTPGEIVSKLQAEMLQKDLYVEVFEDIVVESWGFDWDAFANPNFSFNDSNRITVMSRLHKIFTDEATDRTDVPFWKLYANFLELRARVATVHAIRLKKEAVRYFDAIFPGSTIKDGKKKGGVQLGIRVIVTLSTSVERIYHVKTHSEGHLTSNIAAAELVKPQELLIYKILQYTGFGCETHFIERSAVDIYIATLDAGHGGCFEIFEKAAGCFGKGGDETYGRTLWGVLQDIHTVPKENNWKSVAATIELDAIAQKFLSQVSALDLLSRILRLRDLLNNTENFGFLVKEGGNPELKVIDFRVVAEVSDFAVDNERFGGFLAGNGWYNYAGSHRTIRYGLCDRPRAERVASALQVVTQGSLAHLHQHIESAYSDVCAYISNTKVFADYTDELIQKLNVFKDALHHNIDFFIEKLTSWEPDI